VLVNVLAEFSSFVFSKLNVPEEVLRVMPDAEHLVLSGAGNVSKSIFAIKFNLDYYQIAT